MWPSSAGEFSPFDLSLELRPQPIEDMFASLHDVMAKRRDRKLLAATIRRVEEASAGKNPTRGG